MSLMQRFKWILRISFFIISDLLIFIIEDILKTNPYFKIQPFLVARLHSQNSILYSLMSMSSILYPLTFCSYYWLAQLVCVEAFFPLARRQILSETPWTQTHLALNLNFINAVAEVFTLIPEFRCLAASKNEEVDRE